MALAYESSVPAAYRSEFIAKVITICNRLGINPNWLMIVMRFESANTFLPNVKNPNSTAVGLIQFTAGTAKELGTTTAALASMTAIQQLDFVEKYLLQYKGRMTDLYNTYLAVFSPAYIGRPDAQKVYASPSPSYTANSKLDTNNDGVITVGEIKQVITRYIPNGFDAGSTTTEQKVMPIAAILIVLFVLFLLLNRN